MKSLTEKIKRLRKDIKDWGAVDFMPDGVTPVLTHLVERWFPGRTDLRILEIGTCRCVGASILAQHGTVYTVDVNTYDGRQPVLDTFGTKHKVVQVVGPPSLARALLQNMTFDLAFIDAEHKFAPVMDDFAFVMPLTRRVIWHDYQPSFPGVVEACDTIQKTVGGDWYHVKKFAAWDGTK